jgi:hypothetical protein
MCSCVVDTKQSSYVSRVLRKCNRSDPWTGKGRHNLKDRGTMFLRNIVMNPEEHKLNNHRNENLKIETVELLRITGVLDFVHGPVF